MRCCWLAGPRVSAGDVGQQLRWPSCTGPMVTATTVDASAVRSVGLYCLSPAVSRVRCLRAAVQATALQFVRSGSAPSALLLPHCCTVVAVSSGGACCSASGLCPGGRAGGAGCGKLCAPRRFGCVWYGFCRRRSGTVPGRKRSWCRYEWPCAVDELWSVNHCSTRPSGCAASTRCCNPRRPRRFDVPAGGMWACRWSTRSSSSARSSSSSVSCSLGADTLCRAWRTTDVGAVGCSSTGPGVYRAPGFIIHSLGWLSMALHTSLVRAWRGAKGGAARRRRWLASGDRKGSGAARVIRLHASSGTIAPHSTVSMPSAWSSAWPCTRGKYGLGRPSSSL